MPSRAVPCSQAPSGLCCMENQDDPCFVPFIGPSKRPVHIRYSARFTPAGARSVGRPPLALARRVLLPGLVGDQRRGGGVMGQLQAVVDSSVGAGRGSTLGPDNSRRVRWWNLELECGHREQRNVKYRPLRSDEMPIRGGRSNRPMSDALPPPARVHCERCATLSPTHIDPAVVAGGSETS